ncbi:MAG TPA: TOBE domain-containing protein [Candidatus Saccharimonadaceae bacterium]|nr:TOBE domain-containing protein [Candidatus Saccharimonadaceae bacterium]
MRTLNSEQAAELLHLDSRRVQRLAREGRLPAVRVGRKWLFHEHALARLLRAGVPDAGRPMLEISARNRLRGEIRHVRIEGLMAEVVLRIGDQDLVAVITRSSAEDMRLAVGDTAYAVIKSTEVMLGKLESGA